ncbi:hypothetical protein WJX82_011522 [Trebouxia sp. C0006]
MSVTGKELDDLAKRDKSHFNCGMKYLHRAMIDGVPFPPRRPVQIDTADKSPLRKKQKAHASVLDADSKAGASGDAAAATPSGLWSEATFAVQTPAAHRNQQWQAPYTQPLPKAAPASKTYDVGCFSGFETRATEPTAASTSEALDTKMKEADADVDADADAAWSAAQAQAEDDAQVNNQLRRLSLQREASQGPLEEEEALLTPEGDTYGNDSTIHELQKKLKGTPANSMMETGPYAPEQQSAHPAQALSGIPGVADAPVGSACTADLQEQADCAQAMDSRLHACGATQLASNPAPTPLTLLHGTSGLGEASVDVVDRTESPAKSVRPGATQGQTLRANAAVSTPSAAHFQTQSNMISGCLGPAKAGRPKRRGRHSRKKGWEHIDMIEVNRGDDTIITYMVGDNVYICGDEFDFQKKPFSANFARPACLVCSKEATEEDAANLVECSRCIYSVHLACNSPPLLKVPEGEYLCPECTAGTRNIGADMFAHVKPGCKHTARECFLSGSGHLHMGEILRLQRSKSKSDTYRMCVRRYEAPRDPALPLSNRGKYKPKASLCDGDAGNDSGPDHIPDPHSSHSPHHGHHHSREPHTASGNGHAMNHSIDHGSDSGSECDMYRDPDLATWFGKPQGERSHGPSDTMPQAEYALGSDFASASEPLEACQERDAKGRSLKQPTAEMPVSVGKSQDSPVQKADCQVQVQQESQIVLDPELEVFLRALILKRKQGADPYARALAALHPNREWTDINLRHAEATQLMEWIIQNPDKQDRTVYEAVTGDTQNRQYAGALDKVLSGEGGDLKKFVLVVDRIDVLGKHADGRKVLAKLGTWKQHGKVVIIGVSCVQTSAPQELDMSSETKSLWFKHYEFGELKQIIQSRLGDNNILEPSALSTVVSQVKNTASSDVRELLAVCSKAVNYAKSKSCQALADLEPGTSTAVKNTGAVTLEHAQSTDNQIPF